MVARPWWGLVDPVRCGGIGPADDRRRHVCLAVRNLRGPGRHRAGLAGAPLERPRRGRTRWGRDQRRAVIIPFAASDTDDVEAIVPVANIGLIVLNFLAFFGELAVGAQGADALPDFVQRYSLVRCEYTGQCAIAAGAPYPLWITLFTSMFLHGGWE